MIGDNSRRPTASCRVCGGATAILLGSVEYVSGYACDVGRCSDCGCQFTKHDDEIYDVMHKTGAFSYYSEYRAMAKLCRVSFDGNDIQQLREILSAIPKYRFIIDRIVNSPPDTRLLEIGSSRGYLTSYSILAGRSVLGVDVSREAVEESRALFGDHFAAPDDPRIAAGAPYDLIYHVGTIGCVADPVGLTNDLLALLRPGGALLFNAPNLDALYLDGQLWLDSAPPPDVVTLFPGGFFTRQFSAKADVIEEIEMAPAGESLLVALRRTFGVVWAKPLAQPIEAAGDFGLMWRQPTAPMRRLFERLVGKIGRMTGFETLVPPLPAEFGMFVTLTRK